jgi:polysaccharide biosynthesis/export protein
MRKKTIGLLSLVVIFALAASTWSQGQNPTSSSGSSVDAQGVGNYLLGPGDILDVRVFAQPDLNSVVEIDGDGNISTLPFLEAPIKASCRTDREIQKEITAAYAKYIRNPQVSVRITERKSRQPATIAGAVRTEMQVTMMRRARLHELITRAGGTTDRASGTVQIMHTSPQMCPEPGVTFQKASASDSASEFGVGVYKLSELRAGKEEADPYIWPGDIVLVNEAEPVYVIGAVSAPREIALRDGLTLARAIAMAGGAQRMAKDEVAIYRQKPGLVGQETLKFNYSAIKKGKQPDVPLKPYDIVDVGMSGPLSGKGLADLFTNTVRSMVPMVTSRGIIY